MKTMSYGLLATLVLPIMAEATTLINKNTNIEAVTENKILKNVPVAPKWSQWLEARHEAITTDQMRIHIFRLHPGDDLLESLRSYVKQHHIHAAVLLCAVGSLTQASLRYANQSEAHIHTGHFEIVSATGTIEEGGEHIHLSIATNQGSVIGGHLLKGCTIYTTAEIVLGELIDVQFAREIDKDGSGWNELKVYRSKS